MITLYGSGQEARSALSRLGGEISAVMDPRRAPGQFQGFELRDSVRGETDERILIASMFFAEIADSLLEDGVPREQISVFFRGTVQPLAEISEYVERVLGAKRFTEGYFSDQMGDLPNFADRKAFLEYAVARAPVQGLFLEFGVLDGRSINMIADADARTVHGFDSFEGLPSSWIFGYDEGALSRQGKLPIVRQNVNLFPGWFEDTLPGFLESTEGPAALVHLDADLYASTKFVLDALSDRIEAGTVLVFDEYLYMNDPDHADFQAFKDWRGSRSYRYLARAEHRVALVMTD